MGDCRTGNLRGRNSSETHSPEACSNETRSNKASESKTADEEPHALTLLPSHNLPQRRQQPLHFLHRVVVHQSDAQKSSQPLYVQLFGEVQGIVVSVPGEEAALGELRCQFERRVAFDSDNDRGATILETPRVADAV